MLNIALNLNPFTVFTAVSVMFLYVYNEVVKDNLKKERLSELNNPKPLPKPPIYNR